VVREPSVYTGQYPMDIDTFWSLIETTKAESGGDVEQQLILLVDRLIELPEEDIVRFKEIYKQMEIQAYRGDLWDLAYIIHCGCGNDSFKDFRAWLISQGREVYEKVIEDPQYLADVINEDQREEGIFFETFAYAASYAFEEKTGREIWEHMKPYDTYKYPEFGEMLNDEDKIRAKFPRIAVKIRECSESLSWWGNNDPLNP
jgi:hypothetical protein